MNTFSQKIQLHVLNGKVVVHGMLTPMVDERGLPRLRWVNMKRRQTRDGLGDGSRIMRQVMRKKLRFVVSWKTRREILEVRDSDGCSSPVVVCHGEHGDGYC